MILENAEVSDLLEFVNVISVLLSAAATVAMMVIAYTNKNVAKKNAEIQEKIFMLQQAYNKAALRPRCDIVCSETGGIIKISLYNYGHGTMIINHLDITNKETGSMLHNAYEIIPDNIGLSYYSLEAKGRNIRVGGHIKLIEINRNKISFEDYEKVRKVLAQYTITVYYGDVYEDKGELSATKDLAKLFGNVYREDLTISCLNSESSKGKNQL